MTHRFLSSDFGVQCFACGVVLDYLTPDEAGSLVSDEATEIEAMRFLPWCVGPIAERAHHYVYEGDRISCAYGDQVVSLDTSFDSVRHDCWGDEPPRDTLTHQHSGGVVHNHAWWAMAEMTADRAEHTHAYRPDWSVGS